MMHDIEDVKMMEYKFANDRCHFHDRSWYDKNGNLIVAFKASMRVFKFHPDAHLPLRATPSSFYIYASPVFKGVIPPFASINVPTMIALVFDSMSVGYISPVLGRYSAIAEYVNNDIEHLVIGVRNNTSTPIVINPNTRIAEVIVVSRTGTLGQVSLIKMN